jgi:hypothetical protein
MKYVVIVWVSSERAQAQKVYYIETDQVAPAILYALAAFRGLHPQATDADAVAEKHPLRTLADLQAMGAVPS